MPAWLQSALDSISETIKLGLAGILSENLSDAFTILDQSVSDAGGIVANTPQSFNGTIFAFVQGISENVILPVAALVITYVLVYELISMVVDKNNFHEFDTSLFIRYLGKACIAVMLLSHTTEIVEAVFELGGDIANSATAYITGSTSLNVTAILTAQINAQATTMGIGELITGCIETLIIKYALKALSIYIIMLMYGRFLEIYMYMSVAPIPFATLTNKEWGTIGTNYIRGILALAFQAFLIMLCIGMYATLIASVASSISSTTSFTESLSTCLVYTFLLAMMLGKTGSISKSILNTH